MKHRVHGEKQIVSFGTKFNWRERMKSPIKSKLCLAQCICTSAKRERKKNKWRERERERERKRKKRYKVCNGD